MIFTIERYAGACGAIFVRVGNTGEPHECEALVAVCSYLGVNWQSVPWLGRVCDNVTQDMITLALNKAKEAGLWRQSEHSRNKTYFEIDDTAPSSVTVSVP